MRSITMILISFLFIAQAKSTGLDKLYPGAYKQVQNWQQIWDGTGKYKIEQYTSKAMLRAVGYAELKDTLTHRRNSLGQLISRKLIAAEKHGPKYNFPKGEYIAFTFLSDFSQQKNVKELVRVIKEDGQWRVVSDLIFEKGQKG